MPGTDSLYSSLLAIVLLLSLLSLPAKAVEAASEEPAATILIIAYGPFAGRGVNGSQTLAEALHGQQIAGYEIVSSVLPVRWGAPEAALPDLLAQHRPALILGLGEGHPDHIAIEMRAHNRAEHPDEAGQPAPAQLASEGPEQRSARFFVDIQALPETPIPIRHSEDAGSYLCNSLLYHSLASSVAKVGFVHLPPQGAVAAEPYRSALQPLILAMLEQNLGAAARPSQVQQDP